MSLIGHNSGCLRPRGLKISGLSCLSVIKTWGKFEADPTTPPNNHCCFGKERLSGKIRIYFFYAFLRDRRYLQCTRLNLKAPSAPLQADISPPSLNSTQPTYLAIIINVSNVTECDKILFYELVDYIILLCL